jgi:hypothetical protein
MPSGLHRTYGAHPAVVKFGLSSAVLVPFESPLRPMTPEIDQLLDRINELHPPFWRDLAYYVAQIIGLAGLFYSYKAFKEAGKAFHEARSAKVAATAAGRTVKIQTVTIELTEIAQKLDRIKPELLYSEARSLLTELQRRIRRVVAPFADEPGLSNTINSLLRALEAAQASLKSLRPTDPSAEEPFIIYYATQEAFDAINNCVADLLGLFEKQTLDFGENNAGAQ